LKGIGGGSYPSGGLAMGVSRFGDRIGLERALDSTSVRQYVTLARNTVVDRLTMAAPAERIAPTEVDRARLQRLFHDHHAAVWRALRRRGLTPEGAEDATQETFLLAAERIDDIRAGSERAFLIATALRVAHSLGRKTVRWELDEDMDQRLSAGRDVGESRADMQLCDLVLSNVDADLVEVFVLYEIEGLTSPEIAELLGIPLGSVASRLRRAREQFRSAAARVERIVKKEETEA
jgi:RNA polymerase sigma-70 factor (ECF subfamily)